MTRLDKAQAMRCFGGMIKLVERDPDPKAQDKLQAEYNCKNCELHPYCCKLADTLAETGA